MAGVKILAGSKSKSDTLMASKPVEEEAEP
jgi:hypothetical protein